MSSIKNAFGAAVFFVLAGALPTAAADGPANTATDAKKKVYQQKIEDSYVSAYFGGNRNLGRAWVEVALTPWICPPPSRTSEIVNCKEAPRTATPMIALPSTRILVVSRYLLISRVEVRNEQRKDGRRSNINCRSNHELTTRSSPVRRGSGYKSQSSLGGGDNSAP